MDTRTKVEELEAQIRFEELQEKIPDRKETRSPRKSQPHPRRSHRVGTEFLYGTRWRLPSNLDLETR
ncbi:MAG: hypothetical protein MZU97_14980 [Bacillus subtilis]|nr:hypothetical protein [Bacillus subtilis]